jgi:hypothetical protein
MNGPPPLPQWLSQMFPGEFYPMKSVRIAEVLISPANAKCILENHNNHNRPLSQFRSGQLVEQIVCGEYCVTGQTIGFDCDGELLDGQTRLNACVLSGKPIPAILSFGPPRKAFSYIDQGSKRSLSDIFAMRGLKNARALASAVSLIAGFYISGRPLQITAVNSHAPWSKERLAGFLEMYPSIQDSVAFAVGDAKNDLLGKMGSIALIAASHFIFATGGPDKVAQFFDPLLTNVFPADPAYNSIRLLNKIYGKDGGAKKHLKDRLQHETLLVRVWNDFFTGNGERKILQFNDQHEFPKVAGWSYVDDLPVFPTPKR